MNTINLPNAATEPAILEAFGVIARAAAALEKMPRFAPFEVEIEWAPAWTVRIRKRGGRRAMPLCEKAAAFEAAVAISGAVSMLACLTYAKAV